jgi:ribose/xylose/arabinose/galactoside ABC-type transport system permease subunit
VSLGRMLIVLGLILLVLGVIFTLGEKLPIRLGRLPGDIVVRGKNSVFYFPLVTCLLISAILSFVLWLFGRR